MCGEKKPLGMSELGCGDGCGRRGLEMGGEKKPLHGDERAWLHGGLRTAWVIGVGGNGWGKKPLRMSELRGPLRTVWLQGSGWKGRRRRRWG